MGIKSLPGVKENVLLKNYTTFRIGGRAKYFFTAKKKEDLIEAIKLAKKLKLPFFILGGGSNLLVSDKGYQGLVIQIKNQKLKIKNQNQKSKIIEAEAGTLLSQLVNTALKNNLTGLEWAMGIPGTIGGAIWANAGAFGDSMADLVKSVEVFEITKLRIRNYKLEDCKFGYRDSIFRHNKNLIILSARLQLKKGQKKEIQKEIKEYLKYRKKKQPLNLPSAGSIFKNPQGILGGKLTKEDEFPFLPFTAAQLIEKCGLKGKRIGNVRISEKHANFIVNLGKGKAKEVRKLINLIKKRVKKKFGIDLEEEIQYLGF
jgi:UDP-N-acetylmuramate dehydrogenase